MCGSLGCMLELTVGCGLADDLFERRDALHHLEPAVHAQREHPFLDRRVPDLRGADVLHDQLAQLRAS